MRCRFGCTPAMQAASPGGNKMPSPRLVSEGGLAMIRLLIVAAATYAAYRFTKKVIDDVPDDRLQPISPLVGSSFTVANKAETMLDGR